MSHYDAIANRYDKNHKESFYHTINLKEALKVKECNPKTVLEAGCGTGLMLELMQSFSDVQGIDLSQKMVDVAKSKGLKASVANAYKLPFKDNSFDVVCSFKILPHLDAQKALKEFARVAKKYVVIDFYNKNSLMFLWRKIFPKPVITYYLSLNDFSKLVPKELRIKSVNGVMASCPSNVLFNPLLGWLNRFIPESFGSHIIVVMEKN